MTASITSARASSRVARTGFGIAASLVMLAAVALIWLVAVPIGTGVCPAVDPAPTSCLPSYRAGTGLMATLVVLALWAATLLSALARPTLLRPFAIGGLVLLVLAVPVGYATVSWSSGFEVGASQIDRPTQDPVGQWGEVADRTPHVTIEADGTVMMNDGCNGGSGTWTVSDGVVVFSDMITSLMACPRRDTDLRGPITSAIARDDKLHLAGPDGRVVGILHRVQGG